MKPEKELGSTETQISGNRFIALVSAGEKEGSMLYINQCCDSNIRIPGQIVPESD